MSNATSQSQSAKYDTGTWRAADGTSGANYDNLGNEPKNSRADLSGRVQNGSVYYTGIDVYQTKNTSTNNAGSGFALASTTHSNTVGSTQTIETRGGNSGSWYGSKLESGNSTTHYTTVTGTMGQPFSGMTQTGFNTITLYGTAAQTGTSGAYGSLQTGGTVTPGPVILPPLPGGPNYQNAGGDLRSQPGIVTPVSGKVSGLPEKIKGPGNGGETLGGQQKKRYSVVDKAAVEALFREANRFPAGRLPKVTERLKSEGVDRYGTLTKEPIGPPDLGLLDPSCAIIAIGETTLYLYDSIVILGEGGLTGLTYLFGGPENAYQHRYNPRNTVYKDLFSGKITTGQAILMVEMNYGGTVLTLSPLARIGRIPKAGTGGVPNRLPVPIGHTRVYRAVSEAEYQNILGTGKLHQGLNSLEGKWFADSLKGANGHGKALFPDGKFRLIEVDIPDNSPSLFRLPNLDGRGPARYLHKNDLQRLRPRSLE